MRAELDGFVRLLRLARQRTARVLIAMVDGSRGSMHVKRLDFTEIQIPVGPRLGQKVLEADHIHKAFGDRVLIDDLSFSRKKRHRWRDWSLAVLVSLRCSRLLLAQEELTSGTLEIGETVQISYVDQLRRESIQTKLSGRLSPTETTSSRWGHRDSNRAWLALALGL